MCAHAQGVQAIGQTDLYALILISQLYLALSCTWPYNGTEELSLASVHLEGQTSFGGGSANRL
jgi:hypothetical protein